MVFQKKEETETATTEAWNVAKGYTIELILKPLVEIDRLVKIANYGTPMIDETFNITKEMKTSLRIEAIDRLIDEFRNLIENAIFSSKNKDSKEEFKELKEKIRRLESFKGPIAAVRTDQRNGHSEIVINEKFFRKFMEKLREIKTELPEKLNANNLIFPFSEEVDLKSIKERFIAGG